MALTLHTWSPHFRSSQDGGLDLYYCLGLPHERLDALLALLSAGDESRPFLLKRNAQFRDAYRDIAASLHPDLAYKRKRGKKAPPYPWIPLEDRYTAVVSANGRLADPLSAASYLLEQPWATAGCTTAQLCEFRRKIGLQQRQRFYGQVCAVRRRVWTAWTGEDGGLRSKVVTGSLGTGAGLVVLLALYGDLQAAGINLSDMSIGSLARRANWLGDPGTEVDGDSSAQFRARLGLAPNACVLDVTGVLQAMVEDLPCGTENAGPRCEQQLTLSGPLWALDGCWDPCPGYPKHVLCIYAFRETLHVAAMQDGQGMRCPMHKHRLEGASLSGIVGAHSSSPSSSLSRQPLGALSPNQAANSARPPIGLGPAALKTAYTARNRVTRAHVATNVAAETQRAFQAAMQEAGSGVAQRQDTDKRLLSADVTVVGQEQSLMQDAGWELWQVSLLASGICAAAILLFRPDWRAAAGR